MPRNAQEIRINRFLIWACRTLANVTVISTALLLAGKTAKITAVLRTAKKTAKTPSGNGAS